MARVVVLGTMDSGAAAQHFASLRQRLSAGNRLWRIVSWIALVAAAVAVWRHGTDAGVAWDETFHLRYGKHVLAWFRSDGQDDRALHYKNLYLYGGLFDLIAAWISERSSLGPYETRHLLTAFVALLGVVGSWKLGSRVGGPLAGLLSALMLALTPAWLGHGLFNPKDIPFGAAAVWATYAAARLGTGPFPFRLRDVIFAGAGLGVALAVRPGGVILISYPFLAAGLRTMVAVYRSHQLQQRIAASRWLGLIWKLGLIVPIAYPLMVSTWPWARLDPFQRPFEAVERAMHFHWNGLVLFRGEYIHAHDLPRSYLPTWFAITLPEIYLAALGCGLVVLVRAIRDRMFVRAERVIAVVLIAWAAGAPLLAAVAVKAPVYDGQRHFLFILPPLASLAGISLAAFFRDHQLQLWVRRAVGAGCAALCVLTIVDMTQLHPYEYIYFNRLSGGLKAAANRYETDYWGVAQKEAFSWVVRHAPRASDGRRTRIATCNSNAYERTQYYLDRSPKAQESFAVVKRYDNADIFIALTRDRCHEVPGEVLHIVARQGVPLIYVFRTTTSAPLSAKEL